MNIKPGETVSMEAVSDDEIVMKRYPNVANPLKVLIGERISRQPLRIDELEEAMERG